MSLQIIQAMTHYIFQKFTPVTLLSLSYCDNFFLHLHGFLILVSRKIIFYNKMHCFLAIQPFMRWTRISQKKPGEHFPNDCWCDYKQCKFCQMMAFLQVLPNFRVRELLRTHFLHIWSWIFNFLQTSKTNVMYSVWFSALNSCNNALHSVCNCEMKRSMVKWSERHSEMYQ